MQSLFAVKLPNFYKDPDMFEQSLAAERFWDNPSRISAFANPKAAECALRLLQRRTNPFALLSLTPRRPFARLLTAR